MAPCDSTRLKEPEPDRLVAPEVAPGVQAITSDSAFKFQSACLMTMLAPYPLVVRGHVGSPAWVRHGHTGSRFRGPQTKIAMTQLKNEPVGCFCYPGRAFGKNDP